MSDQSGWNSRSGKNLFHSIRMPAVNVNQMAATTGAVERNFFIVEQSKKEAFVISGVKL